MTDERVNLVGDANLAEATREMGRWHDAAVIEERGDQLRVAGVNAFPVGYGNALMALGAACPGDAETFIRDGARFFEARERGFTLWVREHVDMPLARAAESLGLTRLSDSPGMLIESSPAAMPLAEGVTLSRIADAQGVIAFTDVQARSYSTMGMPEEITHSLFSQPERLLRPHVILCLAHRDGAAQSGALAILSHGVAGVYWVGTVEEGRGQGLGDACTRYVTRAAFEAGAQRVYLQASKQGEPIYLRMGYREVTRYTWWVSFDGKLQS